ncbi:MAG: chromate efflux transporter, partial [Chloroflexi bacterium]|nr:chromate efflux transporter [Chloroflexota bacterium]
LVAGLSFIAPAMLSVLLLAAAYVQFGSLPAALALLAGVQPVVVAVVAHALLGLGRAALRRWQAMLIAGSALLLALAGVNEVGLLVAGAAAGWWLLGSPQLRVPPAAVLLVPAFAAVTALPFALPVLFLVFLKIGAVLYGSGYVLLAFLRADLVVRLGWITERQLLDAVAAGQLTPGPLFTSATFIGYLLGGLPGAMLATVGIFLPAFIFVPLTQPLLARLRSMQGAAGLLAGVNAASLGLLAAVAGQLAWGLAGDPAGALLGAAALLLLVRTRVSASWLLLGGALLGVLRGGLL